MLLTACLMLVMSHVGRAANTPKLTIAVGWSKPPYVIERTNSGYELELVKQIFKRLGTEVNFVYVPYGRSHLMVEQRRVDAALTISSQLETNDILLSDVYITYQNVVVTMKNKSGKVDSIGKLNGMTIAAFQNASEVLGSEFTQMSENNPFYFELPDQYRQVEMLLNEKVDAVVMDANIFVHIASTLLKDYQEDDFIIHPFFPISEYRMGFHDRLLKARFNKALGEYKESEDYQDLMAAYPRYQFERVTQ